MNNNVDLTKILKYCPKGTKLYSTIFGEVEFIKCDDLYQIVVAKENKYYYFTSQGEFYFERIKYHVEECALFPSKDQRDWSKFTAPWYKKNNVVKNKILNIICKFIVIYYGFKKDIKILSRRMEVLFNYIWR